MEVIVKDEKFVVHKAVLKKHSEYFSKCFNEPFKESEGVVRFDDIEPKFMGYFLGLAYSYSTIVPHTPPTPSPFPETIVKRTPLKDYVEVYKLCDRFLSPVMGEFMIRCIKTTIGDNHKALFRSASDEGQQKALMEDFADGFEALNADHPVQRDIGYTLIHYFCEGLDYGVWDLWMDAVVDRSKFVAQVSRGFARKLAAVSVQRSKLKRVELGCP